MGYGISKAITEKFKKKVLRDSEEGQNFHDMMGLRIPNDKGGSWSYKEGDIQGRPQETR